MTVKFNYIKSKNLKNNKNLVLFSDENFEILNFKILDLPNQNINRELVKNNKKKKEYLTFKLE